MFVRVSGVAACRGASVFAQFTLAGNSSGKPLLSTTHARLAGVVQVFSIDRNRAMKEYEVSWMVPLSVVA
ncbi:MAG TPA: hypothetical protein VJQ55_14135 [Candidatus Binatia bacterium]|nr:hypothetical protein [Candidatus Binatia bacterium]